MYIMTRIIQEKPPNLGMIIARKMVKAIKWSKSTDNNYGLPYGKLVSLLIGNECSVPPFEQFDNRPSLQKLDEATLHKMDFVRDPSTGEWVKKAKPTEAQTGAARGAETGTSTAAAALAPTEVTNSELSAMISRRFAVLDSAMARMNANINAELTELKNEVARLHNRHDDMEAQM